MREIDWNLGQDYLTLHLLENPIPNSMRAAVPSLTSLGYTQDRAGCVGIAWCTLWTDATSTASPPQGYATLGDLSRGSSAGLWARERAVVKSFHLAITHAMQLAISLLQTSTTQATCREAARFLSRTWSQVVGHLWMQVHTVFYSTEHFVGNVVNLFSHRKVRTHSKDCDTAGS